MIDKNLKILIALSFIFAILILGLGLRAQKEIDDLRLASIKRPIAKKALLIINFGDNNLKKFQTEINEEDTVFDLLEKIKLEFDYTQYEAGIFINSIEGIKSSKKKGWIYYLNGEMPSVAVDKKKVKPGDKIEFKFEAFSF